MSGGIVGSAGSDLFTLLKSGLPNIFYWGQMVLKKVYFTLRTTSSGSTADTANGIDMITGGTINSIAEIKVSASQRRGTFAKKTQQIFDLILVGSVQIEGRIGWIMEQVEDSPTVFDKVGVEWDAGSSEVNLDLVTADGSTRSIADTGKLARVLNRIRIETDPLNATPQTEIFFSGVSTITKTTNVPDNTNLSTWRAGVETTEAVSKTSRISCLSLLAEDARPY